MNHVLTECGGMLHMTDPYVFIGSTSDTIELVLDESWDAYEVSLCIGGYVAKWDKESLMDVPSLAITEPGWVEVVLTGTAEDGSYRTTRPGTYILRAIGKRQEVVEP